ncbi:MAG: hypothetical protein ACR2L1_06745 [Pyrinomonadaceae bacterium]
MEITKNNRDENLIFTFENSEKNFESSGINAKILKNLFSPNHISWLTAVNLEYRKTARDGKSFLEIKVFPNHK